MHDKYTELRDKLNYRSRASFKILQIDRQFSVFRPGHTVIDLGSSNGGWSQVALERVAPGGRVIAMDLTNTPGFSSDAFKFVQGDITTEEGKQDLLRAVGSEKRADVIMSDMCENHSGSKIDDHNSSLGLAVAVADTLDSLLRPGGWLILKHLVGAGTSDIIGHIKTRFKVVRTYKPPASRDSSRETYFVCHQFRQQAAAEETAGANSHSHFRSSVFMPTGKATTSQFIRTARMRAVREAVKPLWESSSDSKQL